MASSFQGLQSLLMSFDDIATFLEDVAVLASAVVEPPASCGITSRRDGQAFTVASSDARATDLDETQYEYGNGPCLQSLRTGEVVEISDTAQEQRWAPYIERAREVGLRCSISLPLTIGGETVGAMNVYGFDRPSAFEGDQRQRLEIFAAQASGALLLATRQSKGAEVMRAAGAGDQLAYGHRPGAGHPDGAAALHGGAGFRPAAAALPEQPAQDQGHRSRRHQSGERRASGAGQGLRHGVRPAP